VVDVLMLRASRRALPPHLSQFLCRMRRRQHRRESTASDSNLSKEHRRESCLATVQIQPVSHPRHAEVLCLLYLSNGGVSPSLPLHLVPGVRSCSAIALCLGGCLCFLGDHLQVLSPTTRLYSRNPIRSSGNGHPSIRSSENEHLSQ
jgi:hypothetical protein